jgi:hypothetical protein
MLVSRSVKITAENVLFNSLSLKINHSWDEQIAFVIESSMASAHLRDAAYATL